jgi:diguanylate cyclase (GGDEF)-like protein/PAS domain S-box-containing protein
MNEKLKENPNTITESQSTFFKSLADNLNDGVYLVNKSRNIIFWNKSAERITGFTNSDIIGKRCCDNILIHIDEHGNRQCNGVCPLMETINTGKPFRTEQLFVHHKNGHRVPVSVTVIPIKNAGGEIIGAAEIFNDLSPKISTLQKIEELKKLILFDVLTHIGNRRYIEMNLHTRFAEFKRYKMPFGVLFIDIDGFKKVNDKHGHDTGDKVLKMVANTLQSNIRPFDIIGRWGGEEFIGIFVNTSSEQLASIGEKLRTLIEGSILFIASEIIKVTVSIGATIAKEEDDTDSIIKRSDELMYRSKALGKNKTSID